MRLLCRASVEFDAGHISGDVANCNVSHHGHRWAVTATCEQQADLEVMREQLFKIGAELRNRDLTHMLPGVAATPAGVATYVRERINLAATSLISVKVDNGMWEAEVVVERR